MAVLAVAAGTAEAKPKRRDAKVAFDRGVVAYQKGNFEAASEALGKSYVVEHDPDTLFAWAQAERKLEHCGRAIELYQQLLEFNLPAANKAAVEQKLAECREIVAKQAPRPEPPPVPATPPAPAAEPAPPPAASNPPVAGESPPVPPEVPPGNSSSPSYTWYRDPITLGLLGAGVVGTGVGAGFLISARSQHNAVAGSKDLDEARQHSDSARSRRNLGFITGGVGAAFVAGGAVWLVLHRRGGEQRTVTGWLAPDGGGLAITGPF